MRATTDLLDASQRAFYAANGYLVVRGAAPEPLLLGLQLALEEGVDHEIDEWTSTGRLAPDFATDAFETRYHQAWEEASHPPVRAQGADREFFERVRSTSVLDEGLVALASDVLGVGRAVELSSCFYRAKFPHDERTNLPWHQDAQCMAPQCGTDFVGLWIPLVDVFETNSCLQVAPVPPDQDLYPSRWSAQSGYVCMQDPDIAGLTRTVPVEMCRGDVLVLSPMIPHRSVTNETARTRWSVDFRYQRSAADGPQRTPPGRPERST